MNWTLRTRLAVISALVFGALLTALSVLSYEVLQQRLDADMTTRLAELTKGLHGYLNLDGDAPTVEFDASDGDEAAFVHEATQYYQVYDAQSGRLLVESPGVAPLGLRLTAAEVQAFRAQPQFEDITTEYGRLRISNSIVAGPGGRSYLMQVGVSLAPTDAALDGYRGQLGWRVAGGLVPAASPPGGCRDSRFVRCRGWPARSAGSTSRACRRDCRSEDPATSSIAWRTRSTRRWRASRSPSKRCAISARRSPTICARRSPRSEAKSSWRCSGEGTTRPSSAPWPARSRSSTS
jgi:hypothetical protein